MPPSDNFDILYRHSCILEHFKAYFEGFLKNVLQRLPRRKYNLFKRKLSSVFRIYLLHGRSNGLHDVYAIML